jgi:uncharacterized membrane protein YhaH (DUF805 family)
VIVRYYYRGEDGLYVGPLEVSEVKALYEAGEVSEGTMMIEEGKNKLRRYDESFWIPPPLEGEVPQKESYPSLPKGPQLSSGPWEEAVFEVSCPSQSCGERFQLKGKTLSKKRLTCPCCGQKQRTKTLLDVKLVEGQRVEYQRIGQLLSNKGRVGRLEYWLFFLLPGLLLPPLLSEGSDAAVIAFFWMVLPGMPTAVKRLQDLGHSGQWMWIPMIYLLLRIGGLSIRTLSAPKADQMTGLFFIGLLLGSLVLGVMMAFLKGSSKGNCHGPPVADTERVWV